MGSKLIHIANRILSRKRRDVLRQGEYYAKELLPKMSDKQPTLEEMQEWYWNGYGMTPCGCKVEPDGTCQHNQKSWLVLLGFI